MNRYWFRRKDRGFGSTPATWEGWLVVLVYFGLLIGLARFVMGRHSLYNIPIFPIVAVILTAILVWISWTKTEGGWSWRWGGGDR